MGEKGIHGLHRGLNREQGTTHKCYGNTGQLQEYMYMVIFPTKTYGKPSNNYSVRWNFGLSSLNPPEVSTPKNVYLYFRLFQANYVSMKITFS